MSTLVQMICLNSFLSVTWEYTNPAYWKYAEGESSFIMKKTLLCNNVMSIYGAVNSVVLENCKFEQNSALKNDRFLVDVQPLEVSSLIVLTSTTVCVFSVESQPSHVSYLIAI